MLIGGVLVPLLATLLTESTQELQIRSIMCLSSCLYFRVHRICSSEMKSKAFVKSTNTTASGALLLLESPWLCCGLTIMGLWGGRETPTASGLEDRPQLAWQAQNQRTNRNVAASADVPQLSSSLSGTPYPLAVFGSKLTEHNIRGKNKCINGKTDVGTLSNL